MYNEERKERFIATYTPGGRTAYYVRVILNKFADAEENEWHGDLCEQSKERLESIINVQTGTRMQSAEKALIVVKEYVKWCRRNGIKTSNGAFEVEVDTLEAVKKQMVGSPEHLQDRLNKIFDSDDEETVHCIYRAFIWMAFAGLTDVEALTVTKDEVDFDNMVINHNNRVYQLYYVARHTFENACNLTEFACKKSNTGKKLERAAGDTVIRGVRPHIKLLTLRRMIVRCGEEASKRLGEEIGVTYKKIYYSGLFYRTYERQRLGLGELFNQYVEDLMKDNVYTLDKYRSLKKVRNEKTRALEVDYDRWKCVFSC